MQQQGFDYTYDKRLYDRLPRARTAVREHSTRWSIDKLARFLENHDEPAYPLVDPSFTGRRR